MHIQTLQAENSKMKEKMADKVAELRKTQEELILAVSLTVLPTSILEASSKCPYIYISN